MKTLQKCAFLFLSAFITLSTVAQEKKVAVFDPAGDATSSIKEIVREEISSSVVNRDGYTVLERQLINKVLEENKFQMGGLVDDSQISEIGKRMGANYVLVSSITSLGTNYYISCKMIEVLTARIDKQKTTRTKDGVNDLVDVVQSMIKDMLGVPIIKQTQTTITEKTTQTTVTERPITSNTAVTISLPVKTSYYHENKESEKINVVNKGTFIIIQRRGKDLVLYPKGNNIFSDKENTCEIQEDGLLLTKDNKVEHYIKVKI